MWATKVSDAWVAGEPPERVEWLGRTVDLRSRDLALMAYHGWHPVVEAPRPADTATSTWVASLARSGGRVVQEWTARPWTPAELAMQKAAAALVTAETALRALAGTDVDGTIARIGDAVSVLKARLLADPTYALPLDTINGIIAQRNADVNAAPAPSIMALARALRETNRDLAALQRIVGRRLESTDTGAGE